MEEHVYVLDVIQDRKETLCYTVGEDGFRLLELVLKPNASVNIGEKVYVGKDPALRDHVASVKRRIGYGGLSNGAKRELEYVITDIVMADQSRFIRFFNIAEPISMKKHLLEELPGLGKKTMNSILAERDKTVDGKKVRENFVDFSDLAKRCGIKNPEGYLVKRIVEELEDDTKKRYIFVVK